MMPKSRQGAPSAKRRAKLEREVETALLRQREKRARRLAQREAETAAKENATKRQVSGDASSQS